MGGSVNVEVDAAPEELLDMMRQEEYEEMAEKNRQEAKERFEKQVRSIA